MDSIDDTYESKFIERLNSLMETTSCSNAPDEVDVMPTDIQGSDELQHGLQDLSGRYREVFSRKVRNTPAKVPPFMLRKARSDVDIIHKEPRSTTTIIAQKSRSFAHPSDNFVRVTCLAREPSRTLLSSAHGTRETQMVAVHQRF